MDWQDYLDRWQKAGFLDGATASKIRAFEAAQPDTRRIRWPIILALTFGGLLLAMGLFLFVQSNWDSLSPFARIAITMSALAALHTAGACSQKFPALAMTFHAIGTAGLGGAIAISGQVFNMDEHWPFAILLWAIGAWAGFALLRDLPQLVMAAVLTPIWVVAEVVDFERALPDPSPWTAAFVAIIALTYLSANRRDEARTWRHALAAIGAVALIPAWILAAVMPRAPFAGAWLLLLPLPVAYALRGRQSWPMLAWVGAIILQVLARTNSMPVASHLIAGLAAVGLAGWGIAELRKERVNLGLAGFVITVLSFYFSYVVDAINRSLGLIVLGVLFLVGGWQLELLRRRLMRRIEGAA
ncbi:MAG: DUF2157 domain-containing protein [Bryobacteraceae bacterium]